MKRTSIAITVGIRRYAELSVLCIALLVARLARGSSDSRENADKPGVHPELDTDSIAHVAALPFKPKSGSHLVKFNLEDANLADLVKHMSDLTGRRFVYGAKLRNIQATVVTPEPVTLEEAYRAFLSISRRTG